MLLHHSGASSVARYQQDQQGTSSHESCECYADVMPLKQAAQSTIRRAGNTVTKGLSSGCYMIYPVTFRQSQGLYQNPTAFDVTLMTMELLIAPVH